MNTFEGSVHIENTKQGNLYLKIIAEIKKIFSEYNLRTRFSWTNAEEIDFARVIANMAKMDVETFSERDSAARGSAEYILDCYVSYRSILYYRIANYLYYYEFDEEHNDEYANMAKAEARKISEKIKAETNIEIHPGARIGHPFIIDHGTGTSIDECVEIGTDCYFLQGIVIGEECVIGHDCKISSGVILGARYFGKSTEKKRHPTIGNRVKICGNVKILGPIVIEDDVSIAPNCVITQNIPAHTKVFIVNQCQVSHMKDKEHVQIFGVVPMTASELAIHGTKIARYRVFLADRYLRPVNPESVTYSGNDNDNELRFRINFDRLSNDDVARVESIVLLDNDNIVAQIIESEGLKHVIDGFLHSRN